MLNLVKQIILIILITVSSTTYGSQTDNYDLFVNILFEIRESNDACQVWAESTDLEGSYTIHVKKEDNYKVLRIDSPEKSQGRVSLNFNEKESRYLYKQSDIFGWTNLELVLNDRNKPNYLKLFKTTPTDTIYNVGIECKNF